MGRQGSGVRGAGRSGAGGLTGDDGGKKVSIKNVESLKNIKNPQTYKEIGAAIGRYHSVLGVRQKEIKLANLSSGVLGVHVTQDGQSSAIYLNKTYFKNATAKALKDDMKSMYKNGWQTETNKPIAHVVTHEMAHATWNSHMKGAKAKAAEPAIRRLYNQWAKDNTKTGYGKYAKSNVNEFFAETTTKAVHGAADKYTTAIKNIIKKYNL